MINKKFLIHIHTTIPYQM